MADIVLNIDNVESGQAVKVPCSEIVLDTEDKQEEKENG